MLAPATPPPMTTARTCSRMPTSGGSRGGRRTRPVAPAGQARIPRLLPLQWSDQKRVIGQLTTVLPAPHTFCHQLGANQSSANQSGQPIRPTNQATDQFTVPRESGEVMVAAVGRPVDVRQTLTRFPLLAGRRVTWQPLPGGLSHHVYLVRAGSTRYVLRILEPAVSAAGLGIETVRELANTRSAVHSGVGPDVLGALGDPPALLLEYIAGQTLSAADIPGRLVAVAAACRRLHAGPAFGNDFDIVAKRAQLLRLCTRFDLDPPDGYRDHDDAVAAITSALGQRPVPRVPCHNDLLAENFIAGGDGRLRIVDYQLSGNNDPTFELGDIAAEADLDPEQTAALAAAYFGPQLTGALLARTRLQRVLSNVTWTLWFVVHHGLLRRPDSTFDYRAEAAAKWGRACRDLDAPDFGALLDAAAGRTAHPGP